MSVAIRTITRIQDADDLNVTLGAGVDEYALCWDNDTSKFVLRVMSSGLAADGSVTGATASAQPFTVGISLADTTTATTGVVFKGAGRFIHNFHHPTGNTAVPQGLNTFVGVNAGNFTMGSTATEIEHGSYNSSLGTATLYALTTGTGNVAIGTYALYSNTTGQSNCAFGYRALFTNTTGDSNLAIGTQAMEKTATGASYNVAIGRVSLFSMLTASYNVAVGCAALYSNTTGSNNIAVGGGALYSNTTGSNNVAIGFRAGRFQADGATSLTDPENSIYIGDQCRGYDNTDTNVIVIGYTAIGLGANTTVIGNTSTTAATIYGAHLANLTDATTNALVPMLTLTKNVTGAGVGAAGLGPALVFQAESSTTDGVQQARIAALWNDATHATYKADLVGYASDSGGEREIWRGRGSGSAAAIGFLGATPAARIAHVPDAKTDYGAGDLDTEGEVITAINTLNGTINTILATLETFGLHAAA